MNKVKHLVLLIALLLFPIIVNAEGNVSITKIEKKELTGYAYEINPPTFQGLNVKYDLSFNQVGDSVTYIATVQNNDKEEYRIENKNSFSPSGYITYEFKFTDNTNVIKSNETKDMYIIIKYNKAVPEEKLVNGEYKEQNQMNLILVNSNGNILNPNTNSGIYFIILIGLILVISIILFKKHKKASVFLLAISLLLPITTYALKEIKITLNTQVVIEKDLKFCIYAPRTEKGPYNSVEETDKIYVSYNDGMTIGDWIDTNPEAKLEFGIDYTSGGYSYEFYKPEYYSCMNNVYMKYGINTNIEEKMIIKKPNPPLPGDSGEVVNDENYNNFMNDIDQCYNNYTKEEHENSLIKNRSEGCYEIFFHPFH